MSKIKMTGYKIAKTAFLAIGVSAMVACVPAALPVASLGVAAVAGVVAAMGAVGFGSLVAATKMDNLADLEFLKTRQKNTISNNIANMRSRFFEPEPINTLKKQI